MIEIARAFEGCEYGRRSAHGPLGIRKGGTSSEDSVTGRGQDVYRRAVENFIGTVEIPVGLAGPLRVVGTFAKGDYFVPLATTEAALVASYSRGAKVITEAGGCSVALLAEAIDRAPGFAFRDLREASQFVDWAVSRLQDFRRVAESTSAHVRLLDVRPTVEGNHVYLNFSFTTGEAAGQNMVTFATAAVCEYIEDAAPVCPCRMFLEANHSGDKKACAASLARVRGKRVSAEVVLPAALVEKHLRTTPEDFVDYWRMGVIGGVLSGTIGIQGHFANGLAALYIACGQDVACVAESAVGITRSEVTGSGDLYASVTLPNIAVGTVGGGTQLPDQRAYLNTLGLAGADSARALAEVCAALCLAGELSLGAAMCANSFSRAHRVMARHRARGSRRRSGTERRIPEDHQ